MMLLIAAFPFTLKNHLRDTVILSEIAFLEDSYIQKIATWDHKPNAVADELTKMITLKYNEGIITDFQMIKLIENVEQLVDILGKCERIKNTPMPLAHSYLLKTFIGTYTLIMPFGFVHNLGWWTILAVAAIFYVAMSIVTIAEEIEEPFGTDPNDLPVDKIAQNIYNNIIEISASKNELGMPLSPIIGQELTEFKV